MQRAGLLAELIAAELARRDSLPPTPTTFRDFAEHPDYCALTPSPLIAAVMDATEGRPVTTIDDATAARHFGCACADLPRAAPRTVVVRAGGRGGKTSRLLAPKAVHAAWTVPLPTLSRGEHAVSLIIAPDLTLARQALSFAKGYIEASPVLRAAKAGESTDHVTLRRPDGKLVDVRVRAASRGGKGGRAFTLVFAGLDEACFFRDETTGVVNDAEMYRAVIQRIVPGGQCWIVSTPWVQGVGLLEELSDKNWASHAQALCVHAPTRALNPTWDPSGEIEADLRENDPDNAAREIDAVPFAVGSTTFFDKVTLDAATDERRPMQLPPEQSATYGAGGDFAFRRNSSALAIVKRDDAEGGERYDLALLDEQRPEHGVPLKPSAVCDAFAEDLGRYACGEVAADTHERQQVAEELARHNITVVSAPEGQAGKVEMFVLARRVLREGRARLPKHPRLLSQLRAVTAKPAPGGGLSISSPRTSDGAHGDLVSAWVTALWKASKATPPDTEVIRVPRRR